MQAAATGLSLSFITALLQFPVLSLAVSGTLVPPTTIRVSGNRRNWQ